MDCCDYGGLCDFANLLKFSADRGDDLVLLGVRELSVRGKYGLDIVPAAADIETMLFGLEVLEDVSLPA